MTSIFQIDEYNDVWRRLPGGVYILHEHRYTAAEQRGVMAVSIAAIFSILAIIGLLSGIAVSLFRSWPEEGNPKRTTRHAFIKSHAGIYFICMNITTLTFTFGFMLSIVWAVQGRITFGTSCTVQAALKQFGNVSTALWVMAIAVHTFLVVFLQLRVPNWVFVVMLGAVWLLSGAITAAGPLFYTTEEMGPWFTTEYFWMFLSAGVSFILYTLLFLKLRGHFSPNFRFSFRPLYMTSKEWSRVAHQMLWYPVVYAVLVFPIVACRIYEFKTRMLANIDLKMGSAVLFMLTGLVNVILYTITRNIFPIPSFVRKVFSVSSSDGFYRVDSSQASPSLPIFSEFKSSNERTRPSSPPGNLTGWTSPALSDSAESDMSQAEKQVGIASPAQAYQTAGKVAGVPLRKSSSVSSTRSTSSQDSKASGKGRVIRKPPPAAMRGTKRVSSESDGGSKRGEVQQRLSPRF